jgi:hypothetical protein
LRTVVHQDLNFSPRVGQKFRRPSTVLMPKLPSQFAHADKKVRAMINWLPFVGHGTSMGQACPYLVASGCMLPV